MAIGKLKLPADIALPPKAKGVVVFAHGSGSSRLSSRNRRVATSLNGAGFATVLFDLLTEEEALDRGNVFDIALLGNRVAQAVEFAQAASRLHGLPVGLFGASTGAAAALVAAAERGEEIAAVVSRGGRPDLAAVSLPQVRAATLLIVGGNDQTVIELNRQAFARLRCIKQMEIVPGATHLFEEPGALDRVTDLASDWFARFMRGGPQ